MKLKKIRIIHFGQFNDQTFVLPGSTLNVFYGGNEAGKSTTVAFIKQIIFGFYLRSSSSPFFEDYQPLAHVSPMGGSLFFEDDQQNTFELERLWTKGDKTKRGLLTVKRNGQQVPASLFFDQIKNIDGSFYTDSFIFNQEMLGQVAALTENELLQRIYYLGAANSGQLLALRDDFNKQAAILFKKNGRKPKVNQLLKEVAAKRKQYQDTQRQFKLYQQLLAEKKQEEKEITAEQAKWQSLQKKQMHLAKLDKELKQFEQIQALQGQVQTISFNQENYQQAQEINSRYQNLQANINSLKKKIDQQKPIALADLTEAEKLGRQKAQLLEWQNEWRTKQKKQAQLKTAQQQLSRLYPNLERISNLSDQQLKKMQADYAALPAPKQEEQSNKSSNPEPFYFGGGLVAVLGLIIFFSAGPIGLLVLLAGLGIVAFAYLQAKKESNQKQKIQANNEQIKKQYQEFFNRYGIKGKNFNLNDLLNELNQYRLRQEEERDNETELQELAQKINQFSARLQKQIQQPVAADWQDILAKLDKLEAIIKVSRLQQEKEANLKISLKQQEEQTEKLHLRLQTVLARDHVESMSAYRHRYQVSVAQIKLHAQIKALRDNLDADKTILARLAKKPEELKSKAQVLAKKGQQSRQKIEQKQNALARLQVQLTGLADSVAVFTAKQDLANTESQLLKTSQDYLADLLAAKWLDQTLNFASNERFPKMLTAARQYLRLLTGGRYIDLHLDKKISVVRSDKRRRSVKYLSRGTAEQLYFALKLAFIEQIKDEINLPILIDDSFVNFDDQRVKYIKNLLQKISCSNQVLIFTAQEKLVKQLGVKPLYFKKEKINA